MSLDLTELRAVIADHGAVTRIVVAEVQGSAPRGPGTAMLVWEDGQSGTIGGGTLEFRAVEAARKGPWLRRFALGPDMGQCCGGAVTLVAERFAQGDPDGIGGHYLRRVSGDADMPLVIRKALAENRNSGAPVPLILSQGWLLEPVRRARRPLWIYGAGHVGRALVNVIAPLPEFEITWIDTGPERFPEAIPDAVTQLVAAAPADCVRYAPPDGQHLVLTYSHALDLEICHALLGHGFGFAGLIGSRTKWARFRSRLKALGHAPGQIARITCPIGDPALGKHPQAIAVSVAAGLLSGLRAEQSVLGDTG